MNNEFDVIVIGGGAGGMASAIESAKTGAKTLLIERDCKLGGILNQCIHNGFGLRYFGEELTGPEYANRFIELLKKSNVKVMLNTFVTSIKNHKVTVVNSKGNFVYNAGAVVLSMGCREKTSGSINLTGTRPSGIYTAGQIQKMVNIYGKLPGKNVVIVGSGDIGLIMARRLTFEGVKVKMVLEIMNQTSGLTRNVQQCLIDYNIPLLFNTTITQVVGENKVEGVYYAKVDENFNPIPKTEKFVECDCILLSVGLVPENKIVSDLVINKVTNGSYVNEYRETNISGVFACGNVLHVHDLVDNVTLEGEIAGKNAGLYALGKLSHKNPHSVICGNGVRYTIPNEFYKVGETFDCYFRVGQKFVKKNIVVTCNNVEVYKKFVLSINPGEMQKITLDKNKINDDIVVSIID